MKISWTLVGLLLLLLIACVSFLFYLLAQGAVMSMPLILLIWGIVVLAGGLVGCIAWAAGWLPRKKKAEVPADRLVKAHAVFASRQSELGFRTSFISHSTS
jgi:hypothetical protein